MLSCFHIFTDSGQWEIDTHGFLVVDSIWIKQENCFLFILLLMSKSKAIILHTITILGMPKKRDAI